MTNYKLEQEKQDKEFEEKFQRFDLCDVISFGDFERLKSYILTRDSALREAFNKDVGEMIGENIPLMKEEDSIQFTAGQNLEKAKFRSLLEDYKINK